MAGTRNIIKKIVYTTLGEKAYRKAYVKGKIKDIKADDYEEPELDFVHHFINENSTVLDIGANYGHYTVKLAQLCSKGKLYAFEPIPFTFQVLNDVVQHFGLKNTELHHAAVSNEEGQIEMTLPLLEFGAPNTGVAYVGKDQSEKTKLYTVKTLKIDALDIPSVDFIKIDIEGHEPSAFEGMKELLTNHQPVILIEFSFSCLLRAGVEPNGFSSKIQNVYGYKFARLINKQLEIVPTNEPGDGYYFLIPAAKLEQYQSLIAK